MSSNFPAPDPKLEMTRLVLGGVIIGFALITLLIALHEALTWQKADKAADVVAIVGAVTTFLGSAIGVIFGAHVAQAGTASATNAARVATQAATVASGISRQASTLLEHVMASRSIDPAGTSLGFTTSSLSNRTTHRVMRHAERLSTLAAEVHKPEAQRLYRALRSQLAPEEAYAAAFGAVTTWVATKVGIDAQQVDTARTFEDAPNDGYGLDKGAYQQMCDDCTASINTACGSNMTMDGAWRAKHEALPIALFIADAAALALQHPAMG